MQVTIDVTNEPEEGEPVPAEGKDTRQVDLITLQEDDYFSATQHPVMSFTSTQWEAADDKRFKVTGDLTFNGVTKPVTLDVELLGFGEGMRGAYLSGWEATTTIDRTEWGVNGG